MARPRKFKVGDWVKTKGKEPNIYYYVVKDIEVLLRYTVKKPNIILYHLANKGGFVSSIEPAYEANQLDHDKESYLEYKLTGIDPHGVRTCL